MRIGFGKAEAYGKTKLTEKEKPRIGFGRTEAYGKTKNNTLNI